MAALEYRPGVWLDPRRAVYFENSRTVAVADLHIGYAWAQRYHGQLMPVGMADDWSERLLQICEHYKPRQIAVLGDIVHQALPLPAIERDLARLKELFSACSDLLLVLGNHDRRLAEIATPLGLKLTPWHSDEEVVFVHGDEPKGRSARSMELTAALAAASLVVMGHEHPAISLGDGISNRKFPCFLAGERALVLPAFSSWAAGSDVRSGAYMSDLARNARLKQAFAILGTRLLPLNF